MGDPSRDRVLMVGDSLSSDIAGGVPGDVTHAVSRPYPMPPADHHSWSFRAGRRVP
jgi:FMN phosphatase YigB (HAD superfamily)